ncbi:MAG: heparinase II/III family protein [Opitutaceae bacterium]|nr:heparinase II/III family protein [Opitutaceae bacterium]
MPLLKATVINAAEGILDPLWDPNTSGFKHWQIEPGKSHGLRVWQNWCWTEFEWTRRPASGPALRMTRQFEADCAGYDRVVVSLMAPRGSIATITAVTDVGVRKFVAPPAPELKKEHVLDLGGAKVLHALTIEIEAVADGVTSGWINWVGLQHSQLLERVKWMWDQYDAAWTGYLQPESYEPRFEPAHGLLVNKEELAALRAKHDAYLVVHRESSFTRAADKAKQLEPERMVRDFVNFWNDTRYCRERDHDNSLLATMPVGHAVNAVVAGLLLKDKALLRLGARFAMALGMSGRWDDGVICYLPGGVFEHRCFVQSLCVHEIALVLDLAGEMFTDVAREFLKRRIAEEGLGAINFNTWKHEYIFHCNQLAWFTPGRMAGYTLLEKSWPRTKAYTELAYADLNESLGYAILPDGGYVEGPTYFRCVARDGGLSLYYYARARGKQLRDIIPDIVRRTGDFGAAVLSTDADQDVIPICDARSSLEQEALAIMALALPQSDWVTMFRKSLARTHGLADTLLACKLEAEVPAAGPAPKPFVFLPEMGLMASTRQHQGAWTKLLLNGNKAGAGHAHEDKGGFVLEFRGETYAMDPGTCDYSSPLAGILQNCERHNMLIPIGVTERPCPESPLTHNVRPVGTGDAVRFSATIDAAPGWTHYRKWVRTWDSPTPDRLTITDDYELAPEGGTGVEFYWQTALPIAVSGQTITLTGRHGRAVIEAPAGTTIRVDDLPMPPGRIQRRIAIISAAAKGTLVVTVRLS